MVHTATLFALLANVLTASRVVTAAPRQLVAKRFNDYEVHTERSQLPPNWAVRDESASAHDKRRVHDVILPVRINLAHSEEQIERAHDILMDISDPESPRWGDHLTPQEVAELFAPSDDAVDDVLDWLLDAGLDVSRSDHYDPFKGAITVKMPISQAEDLLKAKYDIYEHGPSSTPHVACKSYSVPSSIKHHIDFITPTTDFDIHISSNRINKRAPTTPKSTTKLGDGSVISPTKGDKLETLATHDAAGTSTCDTAITPACLRALYGINYTPTRNVPNGYGIVEYTPQSYLAADLDKFFGTYAPSLVGHRPLNRSIDGGVLVTDPAHQTFDYNGESDLDLEYAMALVGPKQSVNLYQTGDPIIGASFNTFLDALDSSYCSGDDPSADPAYPDPNVGGYKGNSCGVYKNRLPKVVSTSYGYNEVDLSVAYEKRQCNEYMKLGMMGITFVFSSGDYGVAGNGGMCLDNSNELSSSGKKFNPAFPSTCPYILSVGATEVYPGKKVTDPEGTANTVIYSGGGFSNRFTMPTYQKSAVGTYFKSHKPKYTSKQYNNSGGARGYPDISANGVNYAVAVDGEFNLIYGTSASAPVVGAMLALINNARAAKGKKKTIGFINPTLYAHPSAFKDITFGGNQGCGTPGFTAVKGWDPVSGLGTPQFSKLMAIFMKLP